MSRKTKKSKAVLVVTIIAVLAAALAIGCFMIKPYNDSIRKSWDKESERAQEERTALIAEYEEKNQQALADWEAEKEKLLNPETQPDETSQWPDAKQEGWDLLDLTGIELKNLSREQLSRADLMAAGNEMLLVNEWHSRPLDFDETGLKKLNEYLGGNEKVQLDNYKIKLFASAADALLEAVNAARDAGFEHYLVSEGYRSWDAQNTLFEKQKQKLASKYTNEEELIAETKKSVNFPGTSEFNSGMSFTLKLYDKENSEVGSVKYYTTQEAAWMNENCWKFGLVFRFPLDEWPLAATQGKKDKTGVSVQLNLYRFVGKGNAAAMHYLDLCLEEYVEYLHAHPHIALYENGDLKYEIYAQYVGEADTFMIDVTSAPHVSSLDNMGYVVTVFEY